MQAPSTVVGTDFDQCRTRITRARPAARRKPACAAPDRLATHGDAAGKPMAGPRTSFHVNLEPLPGARVLVVEGRYYGNIADALLEGARRVLDAAQVEWDIVTVPGALEVAQAVAMAFEAPMHARRMPYDGIVALGCVIRGETSHYEIVARASARALMDLAVQHRVPIGNG